MIVTHAVTIAIVKSKCERLVCDGRRLALSLTDAASASGSGSDSVSLKISLI